MAILDDKYQYVKLLGEGGFGKVILAKEKISDRLVAIKQLKNTDKEEQEDIFAKFNSSQNLVTRISSAIIIISFTMKDCIL